MTVSYSDLYDIAEAEAQIKRPDLAINEGDISEMLLSAVAAVGDRIVGHASQRVAATYLDGASGADLVTLADDQFGVVAAEPAKAIGTVSLSRGTNPAAIAGSIPAGTIIATAQAADGSSVEVETLAELGWILGQTAAQDVAVQAIDAGPAGNVAAGTLVRVIDTLFDTFIATNAATLAGGADGEDDETLRQRARDHNTTLRRATLAALEYGARQVTGVAYATAVEVGGTVALYVADASGGSSAPMVAAVDSEMINWRAADAIVTVYGGTLYTLTPIQISLSVRAGADTAQLATDAKAAIVARLAKLRIGETCQRAIISQAALNVSPLIVGCSVTLPAADVAPLASQVIRTTTAAITVS